MKSSFVIDETYDLEKSSQYIVSIQLALDGFSFVITDSERNKLIVFHYQPVSMSLPEIDFFNAADDYFKGQVFFQESYKEVRVFFSFPKYTLLPASFFKLESLKKYFEFNHKLGEFEELNYDRLNHGNIYNVFAIPSDLSSIVVNYFNSFKVIHASSIFIDMSINMSKNSDDTNLFVHLHDKYFFIVAVRKNELVFSNCFEYEGTSDFIYFVMNVVEQLKFNPNDIKVYAMGDIYKLSNNLLIMKRYLKNVSLFEAFSEDNFSYGFGDVELHRHSLLFTGAL